MDLDLTLRNAERKDLEAIVSLLAHDTVASKREDSTVPLNPNYITAFEKITQDPNQFLIIAEDKQCNKAIAFYKQLSFKESHEGMKLQLS